MYMFWKALEDAFVDLVEKDLKYTFCGIAIHRTKKFSRHVITSCM